MLLGGSIRASFSILTIVRLRFFCREYRNRADVGSHGCYRAEIMRLVGFAKDEWHAMSAQLDGEPATGIVFELVELAAMAPGLRIPVGRSSARAAFAGDGRRQPHTRATY